MKLKLKFGTPVMVISIIVGVIFALAGVGMMVVKDLIKELDPSLTEGLEGINFDGIFVFLGLMLMVVAVVGIVAGVKAVYSKGWNLFIAIVHGMFAGFALISLDFMTLAVSGVMIVLTIANIKDYNEKLATSSMPNQSVDVSAKLKELEALFDQGLISNEEYYTKREDILNQLS